MGFYNHTIVKNTTIYAKWVESEAEMEGLVFTLSADETYYSVTDYTGSNSVVVIPSTHQEKPVKSIGENAFRQCTSISSITIPASVISIDRYAFRYCSNLTTVTFEDTSTWYWTTNYNDWEDKTGGVQTDVSDASANATYFMGTYYNYYWYKL